MASVQQQPPLLWNDEAWRDEAVRWARARLGELGREVTGAIEQPHIRAWATAFRVPTDAGVVWFKATIPSLAHEVTTLELLNARYPDGVPTLLVSDRDRGWLIVADAGERVREVLRVSRLEHWEHVLRVYAPLQLAAAVDADAFVAGGVPDRRGALLAEQLARLLEDEATLKPPSEAALGDDEIRALRTTVVSRIASDVEALEALAIPASIQHDDLHDANVFVDDGRYRVIDWGDACVSQPLLSIDLTLRMLAHALKLPLDAPELERIRDVYFEPFTALAPHNTLVAATGSIRRAAQASNVLKWHEVARVIPDWALDDFVDGIPNKLRGLLEQCD